LPPGRIYVFLVTSLTVFLLGIILWQSPVRGYIAKTSVGFESLGDDRKDTVAAIHAEMVKPAFVRAVHQRLDPDLKTDLEDVTLRRWQDALGVIPDEAGRPRFHITVLVKDREEAIQLTNAFAAELVAQRQDAALRKGVVQQNQALAAKVALAKANEQKSLSELKAFLEEHFSRLGSADDESRTSSLNTHADVELVAWQEDTETGKAPELSEGGVLNPAWVKALGALNAAHDRRDRALILNSPADPQIEAINKEIDELDAALEKIPRTVVAEEGLTEPNVAEAIISDAAPTTVVNDDTWSALAGDRQVYRMLRGKVEDARAELATATEDAELPLNIETALAGQPAYQIGAAEISTQIGGRPEPKHILIVGLIATIFGITLALATPSRESVAAMQTVEEARRLPLPVAGALQRGHTGTPPTRRQKLTRCVVFVCELSLLLMICALFFIALIDSQITIDFAEDPLTAIAEVFHRVASGKL